MQVFITSSPYLDGADRAILNPENQFIHQIRQALPPLPRGRGLCAEEETASALRPSPSSLSKKK